MKRLYKGGGGEIIMEQNFEKAHRFCSYNRNDLEKDTLCGCFYCLKIFNPNEIDEWWDNDDTAVCPYCGIDSIIGKSSEFPITERFLKGMHNVWF
jgi:hypothetical protein